MNPSDDPDLTPIPIEARDVWTAIGAVERWIEQVKPGHEGYLREVAARLRKAGAGY